MLQLKQPTRGYADQATPTRGYATVETETAHKKQKQPTRGNATFGFGYAELGTNQRYYYL